MENWSEFIFSDSASFDEKARRVFEYQYEHNPVYRTFCETLGAAPGSNSGYPLYPVRGFKEADLAIRDSGTPDLLFESSGTEEMGKSVHRVTDADLYRESLLKGFDRFYNLGEMVIWGYLPGYADNPHSSLVWMVNQLIEQDETGLSRFLPLNEPLEEEEVEKVRKSGRSLMLFGAAFGLMDLAGRKPVSLPADSIIMETGGMKTHKREMDRDQLHERLANAFDLDFTRIHSEYGMTELLSQAYATGGLWFHTVPWLEITIRDPEDPARKLPPFEEGLIGAVDLANVNSCSFLLTGDRGMLHRDGRFKVLGRWNPKDLRGCNFLIEEE